jgi:hypothetical protein
MPSKLNNLITFFQGLYARQIYLEVPAGLSAAELESFYAVCYTDLYKVALAIQKEAYQQPIFDFSQLRKYYHKLNNLLSYLQ